MYAKSLVLILSVTYCQAQITNSNSVTSFLELGTFGNCVGPDAANYTYITQLSLDKNCDPTSVNTINGDTISAVINGVAVVNTLKIIGFTILPDGTLYNSDTLYFGVAGNLANKYIYIREQSGILNLLAKCNSPLAQSSITTTNQTMFIADNIGLDQLYPDTGILNKFAQVSSTICHGTSIWI